MDPYQSGQIEMFVNITGASEADARAKLRAFRGDLNAAIDNYLSEKENLVSPVQVEEADIPVWMDENEPSSRQRIASPTFHPIPLAPTWASGLLRVGGFGIEGGMVPHFPFRGTSPIITQPRDIREIPIDWRDGESKVPSNAGLLIEEIPATVEESPTSQCPVHFVTDDEEATGPSPISIRGRNEGRQGPGGTTTASNEGDNIEDDILRAVLEASLKETSEFGIAENSSGADWFEAEDDDFARAVSLSLKTAEEEKVLSGGNDFSEFLELGVIHDYPNSDNCENLDVAKRRASSSARGYSCGDLERMKCSLQLDNRAPAHDINSILRDPAEDRDDSEEQPLLRRSHQLFNPIVTQSATANMSTTPRLHQEPSNAHGTAARPLDKNRDALGKDEDNDCLASLVADREKEESALIEEQTHCLKVAEAKAVAHAKETLRQEEESCRRLTEEEVQKQAAAKGAALPVEPSIDDDSAVTIMVHMPDGARQSRRFHRSEPLQGLLDFIDVYCGPLPGSYQLVRPYPRKAFTDAEYGNSFHELGLNSKYETLFLEFL